MTRMLLSPRKTIALMLLAAVVFAAAAVAKPATKRKFTGAYGEAKGSKLDACVTCHVGATADLNPYGEDLKVANKEFAKLDKSDSDGDGVSNVDEIKALSFPGDAKDKPGAASDSTGKARADSSAAKPDSTGGAEPDSTSRKQESEKVKEKPKEGSGGKPRFPWSPGFTSKGEPVQLLAAHQVR